MAQKTILLVDDEQGFIEAIQDGLSGFDYRVLKATNASDALNILKNNRIDLVSIDIMLPQGKGLESVIPDSHTTGIYLISEIRKRFPAISVICLSVISDRDTVRQIESMGVNFMKKGEVPLRKVLAVINTKLTGLAYSTSKDFKKYR